MSQRRSTRIFIVASTLLVFYFILRIFQPFLLTIGLAAVAAAIFFPLHKRVVRLLKGSRNWSALISCLLVIFLVVTPVALLGLLLWGEATAFYERIDTFFQKEGHRKVEEFSENPLLSPLIDWLGEFVDLEQLNLLESVRSGIQSLSVVFLRKSPGIFTGIFRFVADGFILVFTLFFLFRDGNRLVAEALAWTPLNESQSTLLVKTFREMAEAIVIGNLLTAAAQGAAAGVVYWLVGIPNPVVWGTLTAVIAVIPMVGTGVVWGPLAGYLFATGFIWQGIVLLLMGIFFVSLIDNVLRPLLIEGRTQIHPLLILFAILGGLAYLGLAGMFMGPILMALGFAFLELCRNEFRDGLPAAEEEDSAAP